MAKVIFDSEKEIEDYICKSIDESGCCPIAKEVVDYYERRVNLGAYGIADIIKVQLLDDGHIQISILEIKKEKINVQTIAQVVRYEQGVRHYLESFEPFERDSVTIVIEVAAPEIDKKDGTVFLINQIENLWAFEISCDLESGLKSNWNHDGWRYSNAESHDVVFNLIQKSMNKTAISNSQDRTKLKAVQ